MRSNDTLRGSSASPSSTRRERAIELEFGDGHLGGRDAGIDEPGLGRDRRSECLRRIGFALARTGDHARKMMGRRKARLRREHRSVSRRRAFEVAARVHPHRRVPARGERIRGLAIAILERRVNSR